MLNSIESTIKISTKYNQIRQYVEPFILFSGIFFNIVLILIIYCKKRTKLLRSTKPLRYLLIAMLVSDTWYLLYQVNVWYFFFKNKPDLSSFNVLCQLNTYLNYFFSILLETNMLSADWILLIIVFKSSNRNHEISIYDKFLENKDSRTSKLTVGASINNNLLIRNLSFALGRRKSANPEPSVQMGNQSSVTEPQDIELVDVDFMEFSKGSGPSCSNATLSNLARKSTSATTNTQLQTVTPVTSVVKKQRNFLSLVTNFSFKTEASYFNIILKEKISLILNFFIWMYLLSFLLWIRGIKTINLNEPSSTIDIYEQSSTLFIPTNLDSRSSAHMLPQTQSSNSTVNENNNLERFSTTFCITHDFGLLLFKIFAMLMSFLRLFTLFVNMITSICFHFKFRHEYFDALKLTFRGKKKD
jgi:hypothetical protein